jgi:pyrroloquinoline quinone biosynthesis protein B
MIRIFILLFFFNLCKAQVPSIIVLGVAQDAGYPQMGCKEKCCEKAWKNDSVGKKVVSLALADPVSGKWWLFEATPDIKEEIKLFHDMFPGDYPFLPEGIFITHAHIGHYTGLMQLGREAMNAPGIQVYTLPKLKQFLETNGPWSQLVKLNNILLKVLKPDSSVSLLNGISVQPFIVPHRDEFSETAGFKIITPNSKYLFIPDIDKWEKWDKKIIPEVSSVDHAFIDATFYELTELKNRAISEVPHPLVAETISLFEKEKPETKKKIVFIHFNHTNPLMWDEKKKDEVKSKGFRIAEERMKL